MFLPRLSRLVCFYWGWPLHVYVLLFYDSIRTCLSRQIDKGSLTAYSTLVSFRLPSTDQFVDESLTDEQEKPAFYICSLERANGHSHWTHQGSEPGLKVRTYQRALPLWIQVIIIVFLMAFSGLFSGLNLGSHYINNKSNASIKPFCSAIEFNPAKPPPNPVFFF